MLPSLPFTAFSDCALRTLLLFAAFSNCILLRHTAPSLFKEYSSIGLGHAGHVSLGYVARSWRQPQARCAHVCKITFSVRKKCSQ